MKTIRLPKFAGLFLSASSVMRAAVIAACLLVPCAARAALWWDGSATTGMQQASGDLNSTLWSTNATGNTALVGFSTNQDLYFNGPSSGTNTNTISLAANLNTGSGRFLINGDTGAINTATVNFSSPATLTVGGAYFGVGWSGAGATGNFNQASGDISATSAILAIGRFSANGTYTMTGGTANFASIRMANVNSGGGGNTMAINISGGAMTTGAVVMSYAANTTLATETITLSGNGQLTVTDITMANQDRNTATIHLNGGTLTANGISATAGGTGRTSTFRFNGGTLKVGANSASFMSGLTTAAVDVNGAKIDINGKTATISQALIHGTGTPDGGLTLSDSAGGGTLILTGANTYTGATAVNAGTLQIGNGGAGTLAPGNTTIAANATLRFNTTSYSADAIRYGGAISGSGDIIIDGAAGTNLMRFNGDNSAFTGTFTVLAGSRASFHAANSGSANAKFVVDGTLSGQAANGSTYHYGELSGAATGVVGGGGATTNVNWSIGALNTDSTYHGRLASTGGGLTKVGTGTLQLTNMTHTYTGATNVTGGTLQVDGSIASSSGINVGAGASLTGSGFVPGITGAGLISPGASPGILTSPSVDPTGGLDFAFEFTAPGSPNYASPAASINDVLALTATTPFISPLDSDNTVSLYFDVTQFANGDAFRGGFFVDNESYDLLTAIADADMQLFVRGDGGGSVVFNGTNYYPIAAIYPSALFDFSTVLENNGLVLQITATTPEPASLIVWFSAGLAGMFFAKRFLNRRK